ncbi:hypothetical protein [Streptomyces microflavus]|uniref:hypothetical protein n=1 Tax=Streptomyces microflavus TaxID=1919 RepID=UPI0033ABDE13
MAEQLSPLERLMEADRQKSAGQRFAERMRQVRIADGKELPEEEGLGGEADGVVVGRLTPPLVAYLAELLEGKDDLEADCIRLAFNIPFPDEEAITAGQGQGGQVHFMTTSLSTRTTG